MIQHKIIRPIWPYKCHESSSVVVDDHRGSSYRLDGERFWLSSYLDQVKFGCVKFNNVLYQVITERDLYKNLYDSVIEGGTYLRSDDGCVLKTDPVVIFSLVFNREPADGRLRIVPPGLISSIEDSEFVIVDVEEESYQIASTEDRLRPFLIDDQIFGIQGYPKRRIVKYGSVLNIEWEFEFDGDRPKQVLPRVDRLSYKESLIFNLSMRRQKKSYLDGVVCALAKADGSIMWKQKFHYQVEDLDFLNDHQLIASTGNQLVVLDAASGDVIQDIDVGMEFQTYSRFLFVSDDFVFLFCKNNKVMQIYDKESLQLLRHFDAGELKWVFVERPKVIDNKLFLVVGLTPVYGGLVVLDLNDIHAPLQYEVEPDISISTPDPANGAIVIQVDTPDLGAVLRFTEMYGLQHAENEGDEGRGLDKNPNFNGKVLLKYGGYTGKREEVAEKLDILKRRFDYYASDMKLYCGKGSTPVTFDYELV